MTPKPLLEIKSISASYGQWQALDRATLTIGSAEIVGLCGPNKAGKSTLCKCIAGLERIHSGEIFFDGQKINELSIAQRLALGLALCTERPSEENQPAPVYLNESVQFNLEVLRNGLALAEWTSRLDQALGYLPDELDLRARMKQPAHTLSGGECQILGIVRKLTTLLGSRNGSCLFVVDEPFKGLSPLWIAHVYHVLKKVRDEARMSVLLVEELLGRLFAVDRVYVLNRGQIVMDGEFEDLTNDPLVADIFTGRPL
jgi:branched-chain amino acid transport system ATP-binding protein